MDQPLRGCGATKNFGMALMLGVALTVAAGTAIGQDKLLEAIRKQSLAQKQIW
jgi:hypothetical protein